MQVYRRGVGLIGTDVHRLGAARSRLRDGALHERSANSLASCGGAFPDSEG